MIPVSKIALLQHPQGGWFWLRVLNDHSHVLAFGLSGDCFTPVIFKQTVPQPIVPYTHSPLHLSHKFQTTVLWLHLKKKKKSFNQSPENCRMMEDEVFIQLDICLERHFYHFYCYRNFMYSMCLFKKGKNLKKLCCVPTILGLSSQTVEHSVSDMNEKKDY